MSSEATTTLYTFTWDLGPTYVNGKFYLDDTQIDDAGVWTLVDAINSNLPEGSSVAVIKTVNDETTYTSNYDTSTFS